MPPCKNNGICLQPGECACPDNFVGPLCEMEKKLCVSPPPLPKNSKRSCSSTTCTISCAQGYRFPDGSSVTNMKCLAGVWTPSRPDQASIADCQRITFLFFNKNKINSLNLFSRLYATMPKWWPLFIVQCVPVSADASWPTVSIRRRVLFTETAGF